jgi:ribonuclease G
MQDMVAKWEQLYSTLRNAAQRQGAGELGRTSSMVQDMLNESFDSITVMPLAMYDEMRDYLQKLRPTGWFAEVAQPGKSRFRAHRH